MTWIAATLAKYPEIAVFLVVGLGYWIGNFKIAGFGLGPVTGSLLVGMLVGAVFPVPVSSTAKAVLFLLFLYGIGYSVGPQFFKAMKGDGLRWALLSTAMATSGLAMAYVVARVLHLDPGLAAGMLSGALTESPAIGTATEAINALPLPEAERARLVGHVAVADAVCYVFGALGVIVFCSVVGPKLLGIDLKREAEAVEASLGMRRSEAGTASGWRRFELRAYRVAAGGAVAGRKVREIEGMIPGARIFVERIHRRADMLEASADMIVQPDDILVLSGRREVLTEVIGRGGAIEVEDREALDVPVMACGVYVSNRSVIGKTVEEIAQSDAPLRGVFLRGITRGGQELPVAPGTRIERGDIVHLSGRSQAVLRAADVIGETVLPTEATDFVALGLGIVTGAIVGLLIVVPLGGLRIAMGTSVGTLLAGLVVGYLHSVRPRFGRIPPGAVALMVALGLAGFVAMIGLGAGPHFLAAVRESGVGLFFGGVIVTTTPLLVGLYFGRYVLKLNPLLVLGGIAGAQTMTAALAAVQERSGSTVAVLGYSGTVAVGHILLTTWGTVIVKLVAP